ncbi:MAG: energy transducer TonB [Gemmatimonadaceae bacterium]|nr:energy transducer TonB [Gemmatimonadaceae bacterium]
MNHQVLSLIVSLAWTPDAPPPWPCGDRVKVETDTTVSRIGADSKAMLQWIAGTGPEYPPELRSQGVQGEVTARFVVDTNGRVVPGTALIISESHQEFGRSVCQFLKRARWKLLPVDGRKRSVTVTDAPFKFHTR